MYLSKFYLSRKESNLVRNQAYFVITLMTLIRYICNPCLLPGIYGNYFAQFPSDPARQCKMWPTGGKDLGLAYSLLGCWIQHSTQRSHSVCVINLMNKWLTSFSFPVCSWWPRCISLYIISLWHYQNRVSNFTSEHYSFNVICRYHFIYFMTLIALAFSCMTMK